MRLNSLFLKKGEIILPKEKWNKLLEVLDNHKDMIDTINMKLNILTEIVLEDKQKEQEKKE
jgi:hypothetical protein